MSDNIDWTEQAGEAVVAQTDECSRRSSGSGPRRRTNGYLVDNEAQKVEEVNDKIVIAPADPDVVYVRPTTARLSTRRPSPARRSITTATATTTSTMTTTTGTTR